MTVDEALERIETLAEGLGNRSEAEVTTSLMHFEPRWREMHSMRKRKRKWKSS